MKTETKYKYPSEEELKRLLLEHKTVNEISHMYDIPYAALGSYMERKRITPSTVGTFYHDQMSEIIMPKMEQIMTIIYNGGTLYECAELVGLDHTQLRNYMTRNGLSSEYIKRVGVKNALAEYNTFSESQPYRKPKRKKIVRSTPVIKGGVYHFVCEECGKIVSTVYLKEWAYKVKYADETYYMCSYSCTNKTRKKLKIDK